MKNNASSRGVIWEVLAPIVRWPLYSPVRAAASLVVVVLVLVGFSVVSNANDPHSKPGTPVAANAGAGGGSSSSASESAGSDSGVGANAPTSVVAQTALRFTTAWARPKLSTPKWRAGVQRYSTEGFAAALQTVDPRRVPASKVTGGAQLREQSSKQAVVAVNTNAGVVLVTLERDSSISSSWLVSSIVPQDKSNTDADSASVEG